MGHMGAYAIERIAESKALARASARRAEKQALRRIAGGIGHGEAGYPDALIGYLSPSGGRFDVSVPLVGGLRRDAELLADP